MATSQQVIQTLRSQGISEDTIAKKVKALGGTYTPPIQTSTSGTSMGGNSMGITGPSELLGQTKLSKPKSFIEKVGNFFAPMTTANVKDIIVGASGKTKKYVQDEEAITKRLAEIAVEMREARIAGDTARTQQLYNESKSLSGAGEKIAAPEFSQYTQDQAAAGRTGTLGDYASRGAKQFLEQASYAVPAGKGLGFGAKVGLSALGGGMRGLGSSEYGKEVGGALGGAAIGGGLSALGQGLRWTGKQFTQKAIKATGASENAIIKKFGTTVNELATKYGKNTDELLGPISEKNRGGTFAVKLKEAENIIQQTVDEAGSSIKIDGKTVINALKKELNLHKAGLDDDVVNGLTEIIKQAEKKYQNGITAKQALKLLRIANSKYGKAMATTPKGSTVKVAQMTIAETMRDTLKTMFPELKDALTTQSEILTLRPVVEKARGSLISKSGQGLFQKGFDVTKPLTYPIVGPALEAVGEKAIPGVMKGAGAILESPVTQKLAVGALMTPQGETAPTETPMEMGGEPLIPTESPATTPATSAGLETGKLPTPTPILSEGGQWQWDETSQDWIPYEGAQAETPKSLTGYTPEKLYSAAMSAYQAGDKASYTQLIDMYDKETSYQEKLAKAEKEKKGGGVSASIGMMEKLYGAGSDKSLSMGSKTTLLGGGVQARAKTEYKKLKDQDFVDRLNNYKTQMALVAGAINQAAGAGVLNGGEYERLAMKSFPNEYTSETVAKAWFDNARAVLESIPTDRASQLSDYLTGL